MALCFTNTLTRRKEEFRPLHPPKVTLYVCGVTVYDAAHIGHVRGAVVFDVLRRFLQNRGFQVTYVRNITDVDDKIIDRARKEADSPADLNAKAQEVARRYTESFQSDFARIGLAPPDREPKATEFIPQMTAFIQTLIERGMAYETSDGVYFSVRRLPEYGKLSHQKPDQMLENHKMETGDGKKDPLDFALWKKAKQEEPSWPSPWGAGRPGWHIECSTMSTHLLGDVFDIHGGGQDLIFPHHENELAQAMGAGKPFARTWLHNGLLTINGQKMAKSLGNFVTIEEVLKRYPPEVLRLFFLSAHYRSPIDFTWERMEEAKHATERLVAFLAHCETAQDALSPDPAELEKKFFEALEDDLNTPRALACLFDAVAHPAQKLGETVRRLGQVLGLFQSTATGMDPEAQRLVKERDAARGRKDFAASDKIRAQLVGLGYVVEDTAAGTVVRRKL